MSHEEDDYGPAIDYDAIVAATAALKPGEMVSAAEATALGVGYSGGAIAALLSSFRDEDTTALASPLGGDGGYGGAPAGGGVGYTTLATAQRAAAFAADYELVEYTQQQNLGVGGVGNALEQATLLGAFQGELTPEVLAAVRPATEAAVAKGFISPGGGLNQPGQVSPKIKGGKPMAGPFKAGAFLGSALSGAVGGFLKGGPAGAIMGAIGGGLSGGFGAGSTLGLGAGGPMMGVAPGGAPPGGVVRQWVANGRPFYRLADGRIATQKNNGIWKTWRPRRNIVISSNPRINTARRVIKLARRLERKLPAQRRPRAAS